MKHQARIIAPDGSERTILSQGADFSTTELQHMVGGYIEHIVLPRGNGHAVAYVNEYGKLTRMAPNPKASAIYGRDVILGPMVIVSRIKGTLPSPTTER